VITWLDQPFKGTNKATGFETLVHAFYLEPGTNIPMAICVGEDGELYYSVIHVITLDWRFKRGKGWHSIDEPEPDPL
jgi:hypothetical protein